MPNTMLGIAWGRKATKSKAWRPGIFERRTTQEKQMAQISVTVGVRITRMLVFLRPSRTRFHGRVWKCLSETSAKASADGGWKYGSNEAQITTSSGISLLSAK